MKTIIIAGIVRSGLTVTMQMLNAGGYPCFGEYPAFEGYEIGKIPFASLQGKAIKVVDTHIQFPPAGEYSVIRLRRNYKQQAKSIGKFLSFVANIPQSRTTIRMLEKSLHADYLKIDNWTKRQKEMLTIDFEQIILNPAITARRLSEFSGQKLDVSKMTEVVRERTTDCYNGMLEIEFLSKKQ